MRGLVGTHLMYKSLCSQESFGDATSVAALGIDYQFDPLTIVLMVVVGSDGYQSLVRLEESERADSFPLDSSWDWLLPQRKVLSSFLG